MSSHWFEKAYSGRGKTFNEALEALLKNMEGDDMKEEKTPAVNPKFYEFRIRVMAKEGMRLESILEALDYHNESSDVRKVIEDVVQSMSETFLDYE